MTQHNGAELSFSQTALDYGPCTHTPFLYTANQDTGRKIFESSYVPKLESFHPSKTKKIG